jgi:hypothetical protein
MGRPCQQISVFGIQDRRANPAATRPWVVRRAVEGQQRSRSFRTKTEADRYRAGLLVAQRNGELFDDDNGEPDRHSRGSI